MIFFLGKRCLRQLHARLCERNSSVSEVDRALVENFVTAPTESIMVHRFLEAYRISRVYRENLKNSRANIQQVYPGCIISFVESYTEPIGEIHRRSRSALDALLKNGEGAVLDALLLIQGRLHFLDLVQCSEAGLSITLLKSDSRMKDGYYREVAWLSQGLALAGYQVERSSVYLLNKEYKGEGDMFVEQHLRRRHKFMRASIEKEVGKLEQALSVDPLPECGNLRCSFCGPPQGEEVKEGNLHHLYRSAGIVPALKKQGLKRIEELDQAAEHLKQKFKDSHWVQYRALREGREQMDLPGIREFLNSLEWPLYCLDFECFFEALPTWESVGVWEHVPFLFSLYVMDRDLTPRKLGHYLISDGGDRREEMAGRLVDATGEEGSILVYGITMERQVLKNLARAVPAAGAKLLELTNRLVDVQTPFSNFLYYHPEQKGRTRLKTLFSLLTGRDYPSHQVTSGTAAFVGYYYLMHRDIPVPWDEYASAVRNDPEAFFRELVEYCDTDSAALAHIVKALIEKTGGKIQGR